MNKVYPDFAKSDEGQEILELSKFGYPLAQTQGDLTYVQRVFLLEAIKHNQKQQQNGNKGASDKEDLRQKVRERRRK